MRLYSQVTAALLLAAGAVPATAQISILRTPSAGTRIIRTSADEPRAVIGISTSSGATTRDTLGVLVGEVRNGGPAEKAGILEGDRIAAVNGVSLQLAPADVGDEQMAGVMTRRLARELDKLKPGDDVELRVVSGAQRKTIKVKTVAREELNESSLNRRDADRATLGVNLAVTGTDRDTLGVFVMGVIDGGPAAEAGLDEGSRIASINGVDLRGARDAGDDDYVDRTANVRRLEREVARAKPGDAITLRVYYDKQYRNVTVKAGRASDLPRRARSVTILGGDSFFPLTPTPRVFGAPGAIQLEIPNRVELRRDLGDSVQRLLDGVRVWSNAFPRSGTRLDW